MYHFLCAGDQVLGAFLIRAILEYENSCRAGCGACQKRAVQVDEAPELCGRHFRIYLAAAVIRSVLDIVFLLILNACMLTVRIRAEEKALEENTAK